MGAVKLTNMQAQVWREGDAPLAGNDGPPVDPVPEAAPASRWPWFGVSIAFVVLIVALRWPADTPFFWFHSVSGSTLALLFWSGVLMLRKGRGGAT